jgi:radical SAM superfamily enzyme YgiQ (UPF0313 family)
MNILILDVYPKTTYRISKDQNGAYGTANNYGDGFIAQILKRIVKKSIDFPQLFVVQTCGELMGLGHDVDYSTELDLNKNYDLYILPSSIVCHETEIEYVKLLKKANKKIIVIGPFATSNFQSYLNAGAHVIKGEPEMFFHKFNKTVNDLNNLPSVIENFTIFPLDELNFPGWEIIFKKYTPQMKFIGRGAAITINSSRGCPYSCQYYCVYPLQQGRKLRLKSPERVVEEMIYFKENLNVSNFLFRDPVFSLDKNHTEAICKEIIKSEYKFRICVEVHLKNIDEKLAKIMKEAGINLMYVGIESGDEKVREDANRASESNFNQITKVKFLEKLGIKVKAMYILGLPKDTSHTFKQTVEYAKKIKSSYAQFSVFTPYPGTPIYKEYKDKINVKYYERFTQWELVFDHPNFKTREVTDLLNYAYKEYYLNPKWIIKFLLDRINDIYEGINNRLFRVSR